MGKNCRLKAATVPPDLHWESQLSAGSHPKVLERNLREKPGIQTRPASMTSKGIAK
jgi:hypothetical protein